MGAPSSGVEALTILSIVLFSRCMGRTPGLANEDHSLHGRLPNLAPSVWDNYQGSIPTMVAGQLCLATPHAAFELNVSREAWFHRRCFRM